ncbi:hypothetical protein PPTG_21903 [Phytophthora nicotianae INRA-310]|uniref:Uncharacterized protein n=1 Tax=Phytophthora nicotianae (strain INRA-310) TaxID=761204 RepID=W2QV52_PHYN3|nr:hypothetical protein PPTG_21903 [Phytophthora nicotianae INRA-310]ETN16344.1 hypothetical protein PPTG_21903 [Phytophthora nicotianae INRA-310]
MAQGMSNIGQSWATTPNRYFVPMTGTTGATNVIPGISSAGLPTDMAGGVDEGSVTRAEVEQVALFTNPQGVYKTFSEDARRVGKQEPGAVRVLWHPREHDDPQRTVSEKQDKDEVTSVVGIGPMGADTTTRERRMTESVVSPAQDELGEVLQTMSTDTMLRDVERAAIYLATVRPTMAAERFVLAPVDLDDDQNLEQLSTSIDQARQARRKARKAAKRQRVKMMLAKRRRETQEDEVERQRAANAVRNIRVKRQTQRWPSWQNDAATTRGLDPSEPGEAPASTGRTTRTNDVVEYVGADDGLPTAIMDVGGVRRRVKLGGGARVATSSPVDFVESIGVILLNVVGVWQFEFRTVFNEVLTVDACVVSGCTDEFLLGVDFMRARGATMDFDRNEIWYRDEGRSVVISLRTHDGTGGAKIAVVRMAGRT